VRKERRRNYHFDFFLLSADSDDLFALSVSEIFDEIIANTKQSSHTHYGSTREVFGLKFRNESNSYTGQLRKIRKADLPEIGTIGTDGKKLQLELDEGVIEKNFFVYYADESLLVMHRNDDGNTASHLAAVLMAAAGVPYYATPVIRPEQAEMLIKDNLEIKRFSFKIPRPTNPDRYPADDIGARTIELLNKSGADTLEVTFSIDSKVESSAGRLTGAIQSAVRSLLAFGATKAKLETDDNGKIYPIDLIADRLYSTQYTNSNSQFPTSTIMFELADKSRAEKRESLNAYFGKIKRII
jgi:hypothetical protein